MNPYGIEGIRVDPIELARWTADWTADIKRARLEYRERPIISQAICENCGRNSGTFICETCGGTE